MSAFRMVALIPLAVVAVACGRSEQSKDRAVDPALSSDLESASAPTAALASTNFEPTRVVSALELGETAGTPAPGQSAAPARRAAPRPTPPAPRVKAIEPGPEVEPVPEPVIVAVARPPVEPAPVGEPAPEPASVATPTAGPRPTPNPVHIPETIGREPIPGGRGGIVPPIPGGTIGGVIIRGGSIGDGDHCERHPGGGILINRPAAPVIRPTFPRGSW